MKRWLLSLAAALALASAQAQVSVDATKTGTAAPHAGTFTWAGKPTCDTSLSGASARISDVGLAPGLRVVCDGSAWRPDGAQVLGRSGVAATVTGTLTETVLATVTIPAGLLGTSGSIREEAVWSNNNSANNKTLRVRLGGISGTTYFQTANTTNVSVASARRISNRNSAASQVAAPISLAAGTGASASAITTGTVDTSVAQDLVYTASLANTGDTASLESYIVWVLP